MRASIRVCVHCVYVGGCVCILYYTTTILLYAHTRSCVQCLLLFFWGQGRASVRICVCAGLLGY